MRSIKNHGRKALAMMCSVLFMLPCLSALPGTAQAAAADSIGYDDPRLTLKPGVIDRVEGRHVPGVQERILYTDFAQFSFGKRREGFFGSLFAEPVRSQAEQKAFALGRFMGEPVLSRYAAWSTTETASLVYRVEPASYVSTALLLHSSLYQDLGYEQASAAVYDYGFYTSADGENWQRQTLTQDDFILEYDNTNKPAEGVFSWGVWRSVVRIPDQHRYYRVEWPHDTKYTARYGDVTVLGPSVASAFDLHDYTDLKDIPDFTDGKYYDSPEIWSNDTSRAVVGGDRIACSLDADATLAELMELFTLKCAQAKLFDKDGAELTDRSAAAADAAELRLYDAQSGAQAGIFDLLFASWDLFDDFEDEASADGWAVSDTDFTHLLQTEAWNCASGSGGAREIAKSVLGGVTSGANYPEGKLNRYCYWRVSATDSEDSYVVYDIKHGDSLPEKIVVETTGPSISRFMKFYTAAGPDGPWTPVADVGIECDGVLTNNTNYEVNFILSELPKGTRYLKAVFGYVEKNTQYAIRLFGATGYITGTYTNGIGTDGDPLGASVSHSVFTAVEKETLAVAPKNGSYTIAANGSAAIGWINDGMYKQISPFAPVDISAYDTLEFDLYISDWEALAAECKTAAGSDSMVPFSFSLFSSDAYGYDNVSRYELNGCLTPENAKGDGWYSISLDYTNPTGRGSSAYCDYTQVKGASLWVSNSKVVSLKPAKAYTFKIENLRVTRKAEGAQEKSNGTLRLSMPQAGLAGAATTAYPVSVPNPRAGLLTLDVSASVPEAVHALLIRLSNSADGSYVLYQPSLHLDYAMQPESLRIPLSSFAESEGNPDFFRMDTLEVFAITDGASNIHLDNFSLREPVADADRMIAAIGAITLDNYKVKLPLVTAAETECSLLEAEGYFRSISLTYDSASRTHSSMDDHLANALLLENARRDCETFARAEKIGLLTALTLSAETAVVGDTVTASVNLGNLTHEAVDGLTVRFRYSALYADTDDELEQTISIAANGSGTASIELTAKEGGVCVVSVVVTRGDSELASLSSRFLTTGTGVYMADSHTHSLRSDGNNTLTNNFLTAYEEGSAFIYSTDHNGYSLFNDAVAHAQKTLENAGYRHFLALRGTELTGFFGHMLAYGTQNTYAPGDSADGWNELFARIAADGGAAYLAHPFLPGYAYPELGDDPTKVDVYGGFTGVEIINMGTRQVDYEAALKALEFWDRMNIKGEQKYFGIANSDGHFSRGGNAPINTAYSGYLLDELTEEAVNDALKNGRLFGTNGPELRFTLAGAEMGDTLQTKENTAVLSLTAYSAYSPLTRVSLYEIPVNAGDNQAGYAAKREIVLFDDPDGGKGQYAFAFEDAVEIRDDCLYRVEVHALATEDQYFQMAFSNPIWVEKESAVYTVTADAGEGTVIRADSAVPHGGNLEIQVSTLEGYDQSAPALLVNGQRVMLQSGRYVLENVTGNVTLATEDLPLNTYSVTTSVRSGKGSITASSTVSHGEDFTVRTTPADGYRLESILVNGIAVQAENGTYVLTGIRMDSAVEVIFTEISTTDSPTPSSENSSAPSAPSSVPSIPSSGESAVSSYQDSSGSPSPVTGESRGMVCALSAAALLSAGLLTICIRRRRGQNGRD